MPGDMVKKMSLVDLRDLVEYLSTLKWARCLSRFLMEAPSGGKGETPP